MATDSDNGHAKNVNNLESLITAITTFGESYNPLNRSIRLPALQQLLTNSRTALNAVKAAESFYTLAVDTCELAFKPLGALITRVKNALKASETTVEMDESAETIFRKLQGKRAGTKLSDEEKQALEAEGKPVTQISVSQMGYDARLDNFDKLITFLEAISQYNPNEPELKVNALRAVYNDLKTKHSEVVSANILLGNARNNRNEIFYKPLTGLIDLASDSKAYIKSVFGASSFQFKQVSKLTFVSRIDK